MKSKVVKLDIGKLVPAPVHLSKLNDVVQNDVVKTTEHDELVEKFNAIQTTAASNLVKKIDYDTKIIENGIKNNNDCGHSNKYITTQEFIKLNSEHFAARLKQARLATTADFDDFVEKSDFDDKFKKFK